MQHLYRTFEPRMLEEHKRSFHKTLKRLRMALVVWLISFIATTIWFTITR